MADKTLNNIRIQNKHKTSAQWDQSPDFVPLAGEIVIYDDLNKIKIGDGVTTIANLPFTSGAQQDYSKLIDIDNYLYYSEYDNLDYNYALNYYKGNTPLEVSGACSSIKNGNFFARSFDFIYNENASFVVATSKMSNRFASIGVSNVSGLFNNDVKERKQNDLYKIVPFNLLDGINEKGLAVSANVVPLDKGTHTKTIPYRYEERELCSLMLTRYILDNFETATEAVEYIKNRISLYFPAKLVEMGYEEHFLISDNTKSYVLEAITDDDGISRLVSYEYNYITNFHMDGVELNADGTVYTPSTQTETENAEITNHVTPHGCGLERYNLIANSYSTVDTKQGMRNLLNNLFYTHSYEQDTNPVWYTEFVGIDDLTVVSTVEDYQNSEKVEKGINMYHHRSRNPESENYGTWQTVHNSIYDIQKKKLYVTVQEGNKEYEFSLNEDYGWERGAGENSLQTKYAGNRALGDNSVAEGEMTTTGASMTVADWREGKGAHAQGGNTIAAGNFSHAEGGDTVTNNPYEHAQGHFNYSHFEDAVYPSANNTIHSIGIGTNLLNRKNAFEVMQNGDAYLYGAGEYDGTNPEEATTIQELLNDGTIAGAYTEEEIDTLWNEVGE